MIDYGSKAELIAAKAECRQRSKNSPLRVSELMKVGRYVDATDRFRQWLYQQGRLTALSEIESAKFQAVPTCDDQIERFVDALDKGHANDIDPSGEFYRGYRIVALEYLQWKNFPGLDRWSAD